MDLMREVMLDLNRKGATIVLSSHQMEAVERLCDRVALINRGEKILDGSVAEVKAGHGKNTVVLAYDGDGDFLGALPGVANVTDFGQYVEVRLQDGTDPQPLLREAVARLRLRRFEIVEPSLHDIFVETVKGHGREAA
jgi:ABC-2 type transport system ATP-binding protein